MNITFSCRRVGLLFLALTVAMPLPAAEQASTTGPTASEHIPLAETGTVVPAPAPFDDQMRSFVREHKVPGAALAVAQKGRVVYAQGFGCADVERQQPVEPKSLFRIDSVSKPII